MAEISYTERLQPSLLDRLTDDEPDAREESREKRVISPLQLRESVRRDLSFLLNAVHLAALQDFSAFPEAARSVINFGLPDIAGRTLAGSDVAQTEAQRRMSAGERRAARIRQLEDALRQAILDFEPRLIRGTVEVSLIPEEGVHPGSMHFLIRAELWAQPTPLQLFLKTQVDLEDGHVVVSDAGQV